MRTPIAATPLALLVLAAGASAYAYWIDRGAISDADREVRRGDVFPSFRIDDVDRVELGREAETLGLVRDRRDGSWTLEINPPEKADPGAVDALLRELELARRIRDVPEAEGTGLDAPRVRGRIVFARGSYGFSLGADAERPEGAAYMRVEGEGTFVVGRALKVQLLRPASAYRELALVPYGASDVERLDVVRPTGHFAIERVGATFRVGGKTGPRASRAAVERLFGALADARAEGFLDMPQAGVAAAHSAATTITVLALPGSGRAQVRLTLAGLCPGPDSAAVVASRSEPTPKAACVPRSVSERLQMDEGALVDKHLVYAHADEIEEVRLEDLGSPAHRVELARRGTGWRERAPEQRDLTAEESDSADALVGDLARAEALEVGVAPAERFTVRARATILRTGSSGAEVLEMGAPDRDGNRSGRRVEDGAALKIARDEARRFEPHPIALRGRTLAGLAVDVSDVVAVEDSCGPTPERLERHDGLWTLRTPAGFAADGLVAADLADAVAHAKADAWIAEADDGTFGLQPPSGCTVKLAVRDRGGGVGRPVGIVFGAEHAGGEYARTLDDTTVFLAPAALRALASYPAIDRAALRLDPPATTRVIMHRGVESRDVRAEGDHFVRSRDDGSRTGPERSGGDASKDGGVESAVGPTLDAGSNEARTRDPAGSDALASAVAAFYAHDALHTGPAPASEGLEHPILVIDAFAADGHERRIIVGAPTQVGPFEAYFARAAGIDATFAVPRRAVDGIVAAW